MSKKTVRQKYFVSKELRISIALIILWSLLVTAFFTYFAKELSEKIGHGTLLFFIVMLGYVVIVVVLTMLFSHRLIGPFQRLKSEIRLIIAGDYFRRLTVRKNDDVYIRSFIDEINRILDELEKLHSYKEDIVKHIDSELLNFISLIEEGDYSKDKLREAILSFHKKVKALEQKQ
jgi:signal transduction histidine kinase